MRKRRGMMSVAAHRHARTTRTKHIVPPDKCSSHYLPDCKEWHWWHEFWFL